MDAVDPSPDIQGDFIVVAYVFLEKIKIELRNGFDYSFTLGYTVTNVLDSGVVNRRFTPKFHPFVIFTY